jgi:hypothetical protein
VIEESDDATEYGENVIIVSSEPDAGAVATEKNQEQPAKK